MYTRLTRLLCVSSSATQVTRAVSMRDTDAVQLDVVVFVTPGGNTLSIYIDGSNDLENWVQLSLTKVGSVGFVSGAKATNVQWRHVRVRVTSAVAGTSILAIGLNTTQLASWRLGAARQGRYTRLATRLCVPSGPTQFSRAVSMTGANSVQVDLVCLAAALAGQKVVVQLQGSNDLQNWSDIGGTVTQSVVGFNSALKQQGIAFRFVRLAFVANGTTPFVLAAGLSAVAA